MYTYLKNVFVLLAVIMIMISLLPRVKVSQSQNLMGVACVAGRNTFPMYFGKLW